MRKWLLRGALVMGLMAPLALVAQTVVQNQISGNEVWQAAQGPGGPASWINIRTVNGGTSKVVGTIAGNTLLGLGVYVNLADGGNFLVTAQPAVANITLPPNPVPDGAIVGICNTSAAAWATNAVTVFGAVGQTSPVGATATLTTLASGTCGRYQFNLANTSWYRVQ